ncbi:hypothetical protein BU15DRAFT_59028 [Melanogaster broomeanus]|nr:hypothetical protein BU15DRAFT_59028 [Melanogaster broomeanus]
MSTQTLQHLRRSGPGIYEITDPVGRLLSPQSVSAAQIRLFLAYDAHLRSGRIAPPLTSPRLRETLRMCITWKPLSRRASPSLMPTITSLFSTFRRRDVPDARAAREADGGMWLDKRKVGLLNESLWTTLEVATRKKERETSLEQSRGRRSALVRSQNADAAPEASSSGSQPAGAQHTPGRAGPSSMDVDQPRLRPLPDQPLADPKNKGTPVYHLRGPITFGGRTGKRMRALARASQPQRQSEVEPAETGRPETAQEFARRVRDRFVLRGPRERKEGGELVTDLPNQQNLISEPELPSSVKGADQRDAPMPSVVVPELPVVYPHEDQLILEIKDAIVKILFIRKW